MMPPRNAPTVPRSAFDPHDRDGEWTLDHLSGRLTLSKEALRLFGIDPEGFDGTHEALLDAVHPDDREALRLAHCEALATGRTYETTHRMPERGGRVRWIRQKCRTEFDADGHPLRSLGAAEDATERHEAATRMRVSHETLCGILETALDGYWRFDEKGRILDVNPAYCRQSGYFRDELLAMSIPDLEAAETALETAEHILHILRAGSDRFESLHRRKDGSVWQVEVSATSRLTDEGRQFFAFFRDITERKRADAELRIAAATFESHDSMLVTDAAGIVLRVNRAFTETTGYEPRDIVGKTPRLLRSDRHDAEFFRLMWESIHLTGNWQGEIWDRRKNGEVYPKWLSISAVRDDEGVVTHYVGSHTDITDRKRAEDKVRQMAFHDPLTALPNRRLFHDRFAQALAASRRSDSRGAVLFVDLDNFKPLNDAHGHAVGDSLLVEAARRLRHCLRETDTVARFGGDEFVVMLGRLDPDTGLARSQAEQTAEKIRSALASPYRLRIRGSDGGESTIEHQCTASIGAALFPDRETGPDEILKRADEAMYLAKSAGRNRIRIHGSDD